MEPSQRPQVFVVDASKTVRDVIGRFPADEQAQMADAEGLIHVDCEFCARRFSIAADMPPG